MTDRPTATLRLAAAVAFATAAACASTPEPHPPELAGCYYFERDDDDELRLPWGVRLLADTLAGWPAIQQLEGVRRAVTLVDQHRVANHPFGYWRPLPGDSLEIGYPAGGGLLLRLAAGATHLVGTARPVGDVIRPGEHARDRPTHRVSLVHARCPDEA